MTTAETKPGMALRDRIYPVPNFGRRGFRWKASAVRGLHRWRQGGQTPPSSTIVVPALFNRFPAETVAMGWLNEIDALHSIRLRMTAVARKTGWDVFTFHTQHNLDHFFDSAIAAVRETWWHEGTLSRAAVIEARRRFGDIYDYYLVQPRLIENLVFQSSLMEWTARRAEDAPHEFHVIGTALLSALVATGSLSFDAAVDLGLRIGARWDASIAAQISDRARRFDLINRIMDGHASVSLPITKEDLCEAEAPSRPFWFSAGPSDKPIRIETSRDVRMALESLNLKSWSASTKTQSAGGNHCFRGWLVSPLHPMARTCRWSVSNYLMATPSAVSLFIFEVAALSRTPMVAVEPEVQNRLRLSRMKVTGP